MSKGTWIIFGIIVVAMIGLFTWAALSNTKTDVSDIDSAKILEATEQNGEIADHYKGAKDAKVVIVEYGDYQCYGCSQLSPRLNAILETYKDNVALVYRNFIIDGHQNSRFAIACAEAAGMQDRYWEMHDMIFKQQAAWTGASVDERMDIFVGFAKALGLDEAKFKTDIESPRITKKIETDLALAKKQQISGTPSVFVNGKAVDSDTWGTDAKFKAYLNDKLKEVGEQPPKE
ncbi:MAG: DsbA family protein [Candidatus Nomurabacteria bacterium]|jgi:protein-disulfide isomerase|nr:DsbA family protein [Candidatus Nomurabacteria bacterium]